MVAGLLPIIEFQEAENDSKIVTCVQNPHTSLLRHTLLTNPWHTHAGGLGWYSQSASRQQTGRWICGVEQTVKRMTLKWNTQVVIIFLRPAIFSLLRTVAVNYLIVFRLLSSKEMIIQDEARRWSSLEVRVSPVKHSVILLRTSCIDCTSRTAAECFSQHIQSFSTSRAELLSLSALCHACCFLSLLLEPYVHTWGVFDVPRWNCALD